MTQQDNFTLGLLTACLMKQYETIEQMDSMLRELMEHVDAVGDRLWRMDRHLGTQDAPIRHADISKRIAKKRHLARKKSSSGKRLN